MAGIGNIIGSYNINPKRISSKLSFEVGQVFSAKIVSADQGNKELILRLLDGWQFPAKLENLLDFIPEGIVKFQVEGFKDGKLQIKIVNSKNDDDSIEENSLEDLLTKSNISIDKEDYDLLKNMIKHNMPLTKENISKIKTILDFKDKISADENEEENFIQRYVGSKKIDISSVKGEEINKALKGFFKELKNISEDEIFTMLENDIELTEDNIKSFLKVFKQESTVYKELSKIGEPLNLNDNNDNIDNFYKQKPSEDVSKSDLLKDKLINTFNVLQGKSEEGSLTSEEAKMYETLKNILKENINLNERDLEEYSKLLDGKLELEKFSPSQAKAARIYENNNDRSPKIYADKAVITDDSQKEVQALDSNFDFKEIEELSPKNAEGNNLKQSFNKINGMSEEKLLIMLEDYEPSAMQGKDLKEFLSIINKADVLKEKLANVYMKLDNKIHNGSLSSKEVKVYEALQQLLKEDVSKTNLNDVVKTFDSGKEAEKSNYNSTNSLKHLNEDNIKSADKNVDSNFLNKDIEDNKVNTLKNVISKDVAKADLKEIESIVKEQISSKTEEIKNIIKSIIKNDDISRADTYEKLVGSFKESINDFKVFNSVSNQYYYLDIPVNVYKNEYQCKLLIKDDRKSGKKIDSKNVSLIVSVKTGNIGLVDAYIKVKNQNMNVTLKCEENWIKILSLGKDKVSKELSNIGYNVFINIDKRQVEASLVNSREFFEDNNLGSINVKV